MNRFTVVGVWILVIAACVILPLYELADYTEVWQHDGDLILPALILLFAGMAMVSAKRIFCAVLTVLGSMLGVRRHAMFPAPAAEPHMSVPMDLGPPFTDLPLRFC